MTGAGVGCPWWDLHHLHLSILGMCLSTCGQSGREFMQSLKSRRPTAPAEMDHPRSRTFMLRDRDVTMLGQCPPTPSPWLLSPGVRGDCPLSGEHHYHS